MVLLIGTRKKLLEVMLTAAQMVRYSDAKKNKKICVITQNALEIQRYILRTLKLR